MESKSRRSVFSPAAATPWHERSCPCRGPTGLHKGFRMIGIQRGYNGLLNGECFEMNLRSVSNIISAGGTILYTARCLSSRPKRARIKAQPSAVSLALTRWWSSAATVLTAAPVSWHTAASR